MTPDPLLSTSALDRLRAAEENGRNAPHPTPCWCDWCADDGREMEEEGEI